MFGEDGQNNVLVVGRGAREHALAWKLSQSPSVQHVFVFPGNGGTDRDNISNLRWDIPEEDYRTISKLCGELKVDLAVVSSDDVAFEDIPAHFEREGIPCFAPSKQAAKIEGSKKFAKAFMERHKIPTAVYASFKNPAMAAAYINEIQHRIILKADGITDGDAVFIPDTKIGAVGEMRNVLSYELFGSASSSVIVEEHLAGDEVSVLTFSDGKAFKSFPPCQPHKRIFERNRGPNTVGMGSYSPVPWLSRGDLADIDQKIIQPTFRGFQSEGIVFKGALLTSIMLTSKGPMAVGYNARFGDPEAQNAMMMLSLETDIASLMFACTQGKLRDISLSIQPGFACSVVISSPGYPHNYAFGQGVTLDSMLEDVQLFHDSTRRDHGVVKTSGARVFTVTAHADTLENARRNAYKGVSAVQFRGMFYRRDIASICGDRPTFIKEREEDPGVVEDDVSATETGVCQAQEFV